MKDLLTKSKQDDKQSVSSDLSTTKTETNPSFEDNSPEAVEMRKLKSQVDNSQESQELEAYQDKEVYNTLIQQLFSDVDMPVPEVKYTEEQGVSSAYYNPEKHEIVINNKDEMTTKELWDNIAFEAGNAINQELFVQAAKLKGRSTATPMEYGSAMAQAEFKTMLSYLKLIEEVSKKGITLPPRAQKALKAYKDNKDNFEEFFLGSAHNAEAKEGKGTLSTVELYAYEGIESLSTHQCKSKFSNIIRAAKYNLTEKPAQPFRKKIEEEWDAAKDNDKPFIYMELIKEGLKSLPDAEKGLKGLQLTSNCEKVAKELKS